MLCQRLVIPTSLARLFINPEYCQCPLRRSCQLHTCSRLRASAASACNWTGYWTFYEMVLKCTHYITRITLNISQTGCNVASQLGFELGSLVWQVGFVPTRPSRLALLYTSRSKNLELIKVTHGQAILLTVVSKMPYSFWFNSRFILCQKMLELFGFQLL